MVETIESNSSDSDNPKLSDNINVPVIFVENRDDEVNVQIMKSDHYSPSVRVVYVSKPIESTDSFGFHLSRSKWDPYPYISRVDKDSYAAASGLKEGDCLLEVRAVNAFLIYPLILKGSLKQTKKKAPPKTEPKAKEKKFC